MEGKAGALRAPRSDFVPVLASLSAPFLFVGRVRTAVPDAFVAHSQRWLRVLRDSLHFQCSPSGPSDVSGVRWLAYYQLRKAVT